MSTNRPPTPGRLRYIALLSAELGYLEPRIANDGEAIRELNALLAEKRRRQILKQNAFAKALYNEMAWKGTALNYVELTVTVKNSYPQLHATEKSVLALLSSRKDLFRRVSAGTYFLASKMEGRTYPLL